LIPLSVPDLRGREAEYVAECVRANWVSSAGPAVGEFETRIAALCGRRHAVATTNGTVALHLALILAGVRPGDYVLLPDWTFAATANAVYHAGATPVLADITAESWTLDPELVADTLAGFSEGRIAAVIAVHALGHPAHMDPLADACRRFGVPLIEDAAGAIGARYGGRAAGSLGDASMLSFNGNKVVTTGGGGMVLTDHPEWAERARSLSTQARNGDRYRYTEVGFNYRMPNVNAVLGIAQIERLPAMLEAKRRIAAAYDRALAGRPDLRPMPRCPWANSNHWLYSVRCGSPADAVSLTEHLRHAGVEARVFWEALSEQPPYGSAPRRLTGVAAGISGRVVSLPSSSSLSESEQAQVVDAVAGWQGATAMAPAQAR
jgi:dTDP-4-amino-4,6-dideoxygalactose transaminase